MKKITALLVLALTAFTMTACSGSKVQEKAIDEYLAAVKTTKDIKSADFEAKLLVDANDMNMHAKVAFDGSFLNQDKAQVQASLDVAANGFKIEDIAKAYLKDDILYINSMDTAKVYTSIQKLKDEMPVKNIHTTTAKDMEAILSEFTLREEDNKKILEGEFNEEFTKQIKTYATSYIKESNLTKSSAKSVTIEKVNKSTLKIIIDKNGYIEQLDYLIDVIYKDPTAEKGKEMIPTNLTLSFKLNDIDKIETINFPNFKDYKESKDDLTDPSSLLNDLNLDTEAAV